jgi:hypothetical protein
MKQKTLQQRQKMLVRHQLSTIRNHYGISEPDHPTHFWTRKHSLEYCSKAGVKVMQSFTAKHLQRYVIHTYYKSQPHKDKSLMALSHSLALNYEGNEFDTVNCYCVVVL